MLVKDKQYCGSSLCMFEFAYFMFQFPPYCPQGVLIEESESDGFIKFFKFWAEFVKGYIGYHKLRITFCQLLSVLYA